MSVYGEGASMNKSMKWKLPILIVLALLLILAACLPALAQQQEALATPSNSVRAVHAASAANRQRR